jgi:putative ABC transport system substrate-binding protein
VAAWPLAARAQQLAVPVIGVLGSVSPDTRVTDFTAFRQGLGETGYVEGRNVAIEFNWSNQFDQFPLLAAELVRRRVAVILANGEAQAKAAKAATAAIPIVFSTGSDPVRAGLVASLNQPGGNLTGVSYFQGALGAKQLDIIRELIPSPGPLALLIHPDNPTDQSVLADVQAAAAAIGQPIEVLSARSNADIEAAFAALVQRRARGLLVAIDALFFNARAQLAALAARHALPAIYYDREFTEAGGLISYGASRTDAFRQNGIYVGRILKAENAGQSVDDTIIISSGYDLSA